MMRMHKISAIVLILNCHIQLSMAQDLPKVIPPSPSTQQFEKYGNYPVSNFTGIPDISIPLYTVKEGDLTVPVTLTYHASGTKGTDVSGFAGMGWTLNTGGKISRTIMDKPDEALPFPSNFYTAEQVSRIEPDYIRNDYFKQLGYLYDTEPDIFSYNFNGHHGKFVLKPDAAKTPVLLPYVPLEIKHHLPATGQGVIHFEITDEQGINYKFNSTEFPIIGGYNNPTGFDLESMTSASDTTNKIIFTPQNGPYEEYFSQRIDQFVTDDEADDIELWRLCYPITTNNIRPITDFMDYNIPLLSGAGQNIGYSGTYPYQVIFRSGKVELTRYTSNDHLKDMLQKVIVYDKENHIIKSFEFVYLDRGLGRVLLKELQLYDSQHQYIGSYKLDYNNESATMPFSNSIGVDYWGYYNGFIDISGSELLPRWEISYPESKRATRIPGTADRVTHVDFMKTFVLNKITYPTGGYTTFDYEANQYTSAATMGSIPYYSGTDVGGLRIKTISNYKAAGAVPEIKSYEYSFGIMDFKPGNIQDYSYDEAWLLLDWGEGPGGVENMPGNGFRRRYFRSEPLFNITPHGSPVVYQHVTEYTGNGQINTGKTVYDYDYTAPEKTTYPSNGIQTGMSDNIIYRPYLKPFNDWTSGNLLSKTIYKNINGNYIRSSDEDYTYNDIPGDTVRGFVNYRYLNFGSDQCTEIGTNENPDDYYSHEGGVYSLTPYPYNFGDYNITSAYHHLTSKGITSYDTNGLNSVWVSTNYIYGNPVHDQPTKKTVISSKNDTLITLFKYPHDFAGQSPYNIMVNDRHLWSPVIEQQDYKNTTVNFLRSTKTHYIMWNGSTAQIYPDSVETKKLNGNYEPRITYQGYDNRGNVKSVSKTNGAKIVYIYSYNGAYPIAQIENAEYSTVESLLGGPAAVQAFRDNPAPTDADVTSFLAPLHGNGLTGAMVTTYTYKPLVGMTTQTDPKGMTTTYEYDNFQRLKAIKDLNGKVVKSYDYHYKQ